MPKKNTNLSTENNQQKNMFKILNNTRIFNTSLKTSSTAKLASTTTTTRPRTSTTNVLKETAKNYTTRGNLKYFTNKKKLQNEQEEVLNKTTIATTKPTTTNYSYRENPFDHPFFKQHREQLRVFETTTKSPKRKLQFQEKHEQAEQLTMNKTTTTKRKFAHNYDFHSHRETTTTTISPKRKLQNKQEEAENKTTTTTTNMRKNVYNYNSQENQSHRETTTINAKRKLQNKKEEEAEIIHINKTTTFVNNYFSRENPFDHPFFKQHREQLRVFETTTISPRRRTFSIRNLSKAQSDTKTTTTTTSTTKRYQTTARTTTLKTTTAPTTTSGFIDYNKIEYLKRYSNSQRKPQYSFKFGTTVN